MTEAQGELNKVSVIAGLPVPLSRNQLALRFGASLPYIALLVGLASMGLSALLTKWANSPGMVTGFYRMSIAAVVMALPFTRQVRREGKLPAKYVWLAVLAGLFFAGDLASWNSALMIGNVTNPTLFGNTSTIWVGIGAMVLFKEKLRPAFWLALLVALFGIVLVLGDDFFTHPMLGAGDLLGLLAGFCYGMFFLATQRARDRLSVLTSWWISAASGAVMLLVLSILFGFRLWGYPPETYINIAALALMTQVAGWLALNYALGHIPASLVAPTLLGQPVITAVIAVWLMNEHMSVLQVIGGIIVLGAILMVHKQRMNRHASGGVEG